MELKKLALEGEVFTHQKEKNILTSIQLSDILHDKFETISVDKKLGDLVEIIKKSEKNIYAVLDNKGKFAGIIELNDIKQRLFEFSQFDIVPVRTLMKKPPAVLQEDEHMHSVMEKFDLTRSWFLPVLDKEKNFVGFISKTKIFYKYREILSASADIYEQDSGSTRS
jgi:CIC family chloride channel protein